MAAGPNHDLEITVGLDGQVSVKVKGVKGPACSKIMGDVRKALGLEVVTDSSTGEFYEQAQVPATTKVGR